MWKMIYKRCYCILVTVTLFICSGVSQDQEGATCIDDYTNVYGRCKLAQKCESAILDLKKNGIQPTFCMHTYDSALVCCRDGISILEVAKPQKNDNGPVWGATNDNRNDDSLSNRRVSERKCAEYSRSVTHTAHFLPLLPTAPLASTTPKCKYNGVKLIVGGMNAELGEFPHMVAIGWLNFDNGYSFSCGGTLISPRYVLTAGHCIRDPRARDPEPVIVRLGDLNLNPLVDDGVTPVEVPIKRIIKHPDYKPPERYNDIALLELATDVDFSSTVRPACLWTGETFTQTKAIATGWGVSNTRTGTTSDDLQKVSITLRDSAECDQLLYRSRNRHWWGMAASQLCAGETQGGKDTCQGDSGAPLQLTSKENLCIFHVIGVTSFGRKCAEKNKPAIYTRVSSYVDWIESIVWPGE